MQRAYHARILRDEDEIISIALSDMTQDDSHRWREDADTHENQRMHRCRRLSTSTTCQASTS